MTKRIRFAHTAEQTIMFCQTFARHIDRTDRRRYIFCRYFLKMKNRVPYRLNRLLHSSLALLFSYISHAVRLLFSLFSLRSHTYIRGVRPPECNTKVEGFLALVSVHISSREKSPVLDVISLFSPFPRFPCLRPTPNPVLHPNPSTPRPSVLTSPTSRARPSSHTV